MGARGAHEIAFLHSHAVRMEMSSGEHHVRFDNDHWGAHLQDRVKDTQIRRTITLRITAGMPHATSEMQFVCTQIALREALHFPGTDLTWPLLNVKNVSFRQVTIIQAPPCSISGERFGSHSLRRIKMTESNTTSPAVST